MSYTVNNTRGTVVSTVNNGTTASVGGITLIGKNYTGYGELIAEDFVKILENNANPTAPSGPLEGQLWWDTTNQCLKVYNSSTNWHPMSVYVGASGTYPHTITSGALWYNTSTKQLSVNSDGTGSGWKNFASSSENTTTEVVTFVVNSVSSTSADANGYSASDNVEVLADVVKNGSGTKQVIRVTSPSSFRIDATSPNVTTAGTVEKYIYDNFTATVTGISGTSRNLIRGVNLDDAVKSEGIEASTIDGSYGGLSGGASLSQIVRESRNYLIKNTSYTALAGEQIGVNTTAGSVTITLPGTPAAGETVTVADSHNQWSSNSCIVARNGNTIDGASADLTLSQRDEVTLLYNGSGWRQIRGSAVYG
mgnify:CR=1 FL=1